MSDLQIPDFLNRNLKGQNMTHQATPAPTRTRTAKRDAYVALVKITVPIDVSDTSTLAKAVDAVQGLTKHLPAEATVEIDAKLARV